MVNCLEILLIGPNAHFDAKIVPFIQVPGTSVTNYLAVLWFDEQRSLPECVRQRRKTKTGEESLSGSGYLGGVVALRLEQLRQVVAFVGIFGSDQIIDVPHS